VVARMSAASAANIRVFMGSLRVNSVGGGGALITAPVEWQF
jgi:hypothetical protein